ncbi:hypothetical protein SUGI_0281170 [Cryptomeria japonica]|nr:hypothetical protein SUGI_0281170 [Cryptomeria japonica]
MAQWKAQGMNCLPVMPHNLHNVHLLKGHVLQHRQTQSWYSTLTREPPFNFPFPPYYFRRMTQVLLISYNNFLRLMLHTLSQTKINL